MIAGLLTAIAVAFIGVLIQVPVTENPLTKLLKDPSSVVPIAIFGVTIGPLFEELIFRGFLQPLLARGAGAVAGIILANIPFGILHYWEYGKSWRHVVVIMIAGMAFGCMRQITGSTRASTLMHAAYNGLFFFAMFYSKSAAR
jgi:membrane protease YdiL (CAAX protease family)